MDFKKGGVQLTYWIASVYSLIFSRYALWQWRLTILARDLRSQSLKTSSQFLHYVGRQYLPSGTSDSYLIFQIKKFLNVRTIFQIVCQIHLTATNSDWYHYSRSISCSVFILTHQILAYTYISMAIHMMSWYGDTTYYYPYILLFGVVLHAKVWIRDRNYKSVKNHRNQWTQKEESNSRFETNVFWHVKVWIQDANYKSRKIYRDPGSKEESNARFEFSVFWHVKVWKQNANYKSRNNYRDQ